MVPFIKTKESRRKKKGRSVLGSLAAPLGRFIYGPLIKMKATTAYITHMCLFSRIREPVGKVDSKLVSGKLEWGGSSDLG